jgi:hypothetical protein
MLPVFSLGRITSMSLGYISILPIENAAVLVERPQDAHLVEAIFLRFELPDFV